MLIGFNWIEKDKLAGSGKPGLYKDANDDITFLKKKGITTIVSLTQKKLDEDFNDKGFDIIHFPIPDMGIPLPKTAHKVCSDIKTRMDKGEKVLVHCKAGLGRTGTILACILVEYGYSPNDAILEVRKNIRMAIQNALQENFVKHYYDFLQKEITQ